MNKIDRLLLDDMHRLVDRVATLAPDGPVGTLAAHTQLRSLIDAAETRLTALRADLSERYGQWEEAIEECEDLWALCVLKQDERGRDMDRWAA